MVLDTRFTRATYSGCAYSSAERTNNCRLIKPDVGAIDIALFDRASLSARPKRHFWGTCSPVVRKAREARFCRVDSRVRASGSIAPALAEWTGCFFQLWRLVMASVPAVLGVDISAVPADEDKVCCSLLPSSSAPAGVKYL